MELIYCESCGDVIPAPEGSDGLSAVCAACGPDGSGAAPTRPKPAAEDADTAATGDWLASDDLELYSSQSVVIRKKDLPRAPSGPLDTEGLDVGSVRVDRSRGSSASRREPARSRRGPAKAGASTRERKPARETEGAAQGGSQQLAFFDEGNSKTLDSEGEQPRGSEAPSQKARKILFRCPHCKSPLAVRPVKSDSRLVCPTCEKSVFITISGQLFKSQELRKSHKEKKAAEQREKLLKTPLRTDNPLSEGESGTEQATPPAATIDLHHGAGVKDGDLSNQTIPLSKSPGSAPPGATIALPKSGASRGSGQPGPTMVLTEDKTTALRDIDLNPKPPPEPVAAAVPTRARPEDYLVKNSLSDADAALQDELLGIGQTTHSPLLGVREQADRILADGPLEESCDNIDPLPERTSMGGARLTVRALAVSLCLVLPLLTLGALRSGLPATGDPSAQNGETSLVLELGDTARRGVKAIIDKAAGLFGGH